jgi:citrate synthase
MSETTYAKGLEGVIAAESAICRINGEQGLLSYRGYTIEDLAENSNFEESAWLLLYGALPTSEELEGFTRKLVASRAVPESVLNALHALVPSTHPMIALQTAVAALGGIDPVAAGHNDANFDRAIQLIAQFPTIIAAW